MVSDKCAVCGGWSGDLVHAIPGTAMYAQLSTKGLVALEGDLQGGHAFVPATEPEAEQDSAARKRIDAYLAHRRQRGWNDMLFSSPASGVELNESDIAAVLADADRDHEFAEAVRAACERLKPYEFEVGAQIDGAHQRIYGTPCTKGKS